MVLRRRVRRDTLIDLVAPVVDCHWARMSATSMRIRALSPFAPCGTTMPV